MVFPGYIVGLALAYPFGPPFFPDKPWWDAFVANLNDLCLADGRISINVQNCEFTRVRAMRLTLLGHGAIALEKGVPKAVLGADEGSLFQLMATEAMHARARPPRSNASCATCALKGSGQRLRARWCGLREAGD